MGHIGMSNEGEKETMKEDNVDVGWYTGKQELGSGQG